MLSIKFRFSSAVYRARRKKGLTQEQVAEVVDISVRWYQKIEKGEVLPSTELTLHLIEYLEINAADLAEATILQTVV